MSAALTTTSVSERAAGLVATVTLNRAERLNALNSPLIEELTETLCMLRDNPELRAIVLTGAGPKAFVGGADIHEMAAFGNAADGRKFISKLHRCCVAMRAIPVPTIARINGYCFGGGLKLAAACDVRVASENALFGMPEVRLGIPSVIEAALLPGLIGWGRTRELLLFGENFSAAQALEWNFVQYAVLTCPTRVVHRLS